MTNLNNDYEVVAKYIKDISFEIPDPDCFVSAAEKLSEYTTKLDLSSKPFKNNLIELNCKFILEAPEHVEKKYMLIFVWQLFLKLTIKNLQPIK